MINSIVRESFGDFANVFVVRIDEHTEHRKAQAEDLPLIQGLVEDERADEYDQQRFRMSNHIVGHGREISDHPKDTEVNEEGDHTAQQQKRQRVGVHEFPQVTQRFEEWQANE